MPRQDLIPLRRGTKASWESANPTLAEGEPGFELDTGHIKIGDGSTSWNNLKYLHNPSYDVIGTEWNTASTSPTLKRINGFNEKIVLNPSDIDTLPIYEAIKIRNLADDGTVNAVYGDSSFALDGTNGQVMTCYPKFYYKRGWADDAHTILRVLISPTPKFGFDVHPAFKKAGVELDEFNWGTFEGSVYDTSASAYIPDDSAGYDFTATTGDKLSSVAGVKPASGMNNALTINAARTLAHNRGSGWELTTFYQLWAIQTLFYTKYATLNSQSIFNGVTNLPSGTGNESLNTGYTMGVGTGAVDLHGNDGEVSVLGTNPFMALKCENIYGNIWKFIDGINIKADHNPWLADNNYASDKFESPYVDTGLTLPDTNGYISAIHPEYGYLCAGITGASNYYLCDYYYQSTGNCIARFSGNWNEGARAGLCCLNLSNPASSSNRAIGARLSYS
jgi:hypothetical protein